MNAGFSSTSKEREEPEIANNSQCYTVLEIRKKSRLSIWQMPDNLAPGFGCPDEELVSLTFGD